MKFDPVVQFLHDGFVDGVNLFLLVQDGELTLSLDVHLASVSAQVGVAYGRGNCQHLTSSHAVEASVKTELLKLIANQL